LSGKRGPDGMMSINIEKCPPADCQERIRNVGKQSGSEAGYGTSCQEALSNVERVVRQIVRQVIE
jgi:hypothetical protein